MSSGRFLFDSFLTSNFFTDQRDEHQEEEEEETKGSRRELGVSD